jgi:hypothetical protein
LTRLYYEGSNGALCKREFSLSLLERKRFFVCSLFLLLT